MDRLVIDKTGIAGNVEFRLLFAPDDSTPGVNTIPAGDAAPLADDPGGASIFTALQKQLGLKLEAARGAREHLVIDNVSRPSAN